jgi:hypothetical protein
MPGALSLMHLYPIDRAVHRVGPNDTAWNARSATWAMVIAGIDPDPRKAGELATWARRYGTAIHAHTGGGGYINFMMATLTTPGSPRRTVTITSRWWP